MTSRPSRWRAGPRTLLRLVIGLWVFGTGEALIIDGAIGTSPWTVLAQGVAVHTPLSIGAATVVISGLVLLAWLPLRERPGLGTVCDAVLVGVAIDVMRPLLPDPGALPLQVAQVVGGVLVVGLGSGLYLTAALGPGPRDGLMTGLARRTAAPVALVRGGIEGTALVTGWLLGGTVGLGTVLFALLVGPSVALALRLLDRDDVVIGPRASSPAR